MRAGRLRHRVKLQSVSETPDSYGERTETWATYATVWASIRPVSGREVVEATQVGGEVQTLIEIRYNSSVTVKDRVKFGTRLFDINHVANPENRNEKQRLTCTEVV